MSEVSLWTSIPIWSTHESPGPSDANDSPGPYCLHTIRWSTLAKTWYLSPERDFIIVNLLVRNHSVIAMIRWTGLAPLKFESVRQSGSQIDRQSGSEAVRQ